MFDNLFRNKKLNTEQDIKQSNSFCIMPWVHFHVTQHGTVTPCCQAPWQEEYSFGNINKQSIDDIWNGKEIGTFRNTILENKIDERCKSCFIKEQQGFTSLRKITNHKYAHKFDLPLLTNKLGLIPNTKPIYFDVRFSNVCNLKCRICGPWSSSNWHNDAVKLGMVKEDSKAITYAFNNVESFFNQFVEMIELLEELYFAGGEPLVMDEHYRILNLLISNNRTNVRLTYNTNFSSLQYKQHNLIELWKQFKTISIAASLDAEAERGELLRKNIKWNDVIKNRRLIQKELPHIEFVVSTTLNSYNVIHIPDFHRNWVNEKLIHVEDFIPTLLVKPEELSISSLPMDFKFSASQLYLKHFDWIKTQQYINEEKRTYMLLQFENIVKVLSSNHNKNLSVAFKKNADALDNVREENTLNVFPELKNLIQ